MASSIVDAAVRMFSWEQLSNPINVVLLVLFVLLIREAASSPAPKPAAPTQNKEVTEFRDAITLEELRQYDGSQPSKPIWMAIQGKVFDVTSKRSFYGPGGMYGNFAGRDASRGLAKHSFDKAMVKDEPDSLEDLTPDERKELKQWFEFFSSRYPHVGNLAKA